MNRGLSILLFALSLIIFSGSAFAEGQEKVIRVGWHEAPYYMTDSYGRHPAL